MQDETNKYILSFVPKMIENNISYEYSVANFENIINYTKKISENYWNDIMENIILMIFANNSEFESSYTLNLFAFDNQKKLRKKKYQNNVFKEMLSSLKENKIVVSSEILDLLIEKPDEEEKNPNKHEHLNKIKEKLEKCPFILLIKILYNQKIENIKKYIPE